MTPGAASTSLTAKRASAKSSCFRVKPRPSFICCTAAPGVKFDPLRHQAVSATPSAEVAADHIVTVVQKGFALRERLLRPAMVVVAAADKPA